MPHTTKNVRFALAGGGPNLARSGGTIPAKKGKHLQRGINLFLCTIREGRGGLDLPEQLDAVESTQIEF